MPYIVDRGKIVPVNVDAKYDSKPLPYPSNDLMSVYTHWDPELKRNVSTPNELPITNKINNGGIENAEY